MKSFFLFDSILYRDKEGNPISHEAWADLVENKEYTVIKQDKIGPYRISTVWLGLTHVHGHFFETMIFHDNEEKDSLDLWMERYSSLSAAKLGHEAAISMVKDKLKIS